MLLLYFPQAMVVRYLLPEELHWLHCLAWLLSIDLALRIVFDRSLASGDWDLRRTSLAHWRADKASDLPWWLRALLGIGLLSLLLGALVGPLLMVDDAIPEALYVLPLIVAVLVTVWIMVPRTERPAAPPPPPALDVEEQVEAVNDGRT